MGEDLNWKKTCEADYLHNCQNHSEMNLVYGRIYTPRQGYSHSDTNNLILNLKKSVDASTAELHYKNKAIQQFAVEAFQFLKNSQETQFIIVPMPSSKRKSNPEYDDRIERVAKFVASRLKGGAASLEILYGNADREAAHQNNEARSPELIYNSMSLDEDIASEVDNWNRIIVIDDVLTSGAHFSAAYKHLHERFPSASISGLFWAKSQDPTDFSLPFDEPW
jgi:predicted amidophosphoribosyltransferase